jgi:hypothetical protein
MNGKYDYDDKERFEYLGIAKVRFNAQGYTKVAVTSVARTATLLDLGHT